MVSGDPTGQCQTAHSSTIGEQRGTNYALAPMTEHPDATFGKVDTEAQPELPAQFGIQSIPTLMVLRDGTS